MTLSNEEKAINLKNEFPKGSFITSTFYYDGGYSRCIGWVNRIEGYGNDGAFCYYFLNAKNELLKDDIIGLFIDDMSNVRASTQKEIDELFKAITNNGYSLDECYTAIKGTTLGGVLEFIENAYLSKEDTKVLIRKLMDKI